MKPDILLFSQISTFWPLADLLSMKLCRQPLFVWPVIFKITTAYKLITLLQCPAFRQGIVKWIRPVMIRLISKNRVRIPKNLMFYYKLLIQRAGRVLLPLPGVNIHIGENLIAMQNLWVIWGILGIFSKPAHFSVMLFFLFLRGYFSAALDTLP